jgi:hypothetical protein
MIPASRDGETLEELESPVVLARFILERYIHDYRERN